MAKRKDKKNQQALKGLVVVIIIAIITILGDKVRLDNLNNLVDEVSSNNIIMNQTVADSSEVIEGENVEVYYLDVGQADSILVQSNGVNMLIDAGTNDMGKTVVKDLQELGIKKMKAKSIQNVILFCQILILKRWKMQVYFWIRISATLQLMQRVFL